ncbi:MAG: hypothetical protein ACOVK2_03460 [Candidatus Fonsibacter sp.]
MTPKEKAIELYEKFTFPCWECDEFAKAKQCALIAVDEIIWLLNNNQIDIDYYQEVKQEINGI